MSEKREVNPSLSSNYIFNLANRIIVLVIPLITTPYLTRVLGANELGIFNYANTIASYYLMISMMGMSILGNKKVSLARGERKEKENEIFSRLFFVQIINSLISIILYLGYILFICDSNRTVAVLQLLVLISALFDVSWFYQGLERFKNIALRNIIVNCITTAMIFLLVKSSEDIIIYTVIKCLSVLCSQLVLFISCVKDIVWVGIKADWLKSTYKELLILFIPIAAESIFHNMDRVMLGIMVSYSAVAFYYTSRMITDIPQCFITSINTIMYPRITVLVGQNNTSEAKKLTYYSFVLINGVCVAMAFGIAAIAKDFVALYLGAEYQYCAICIPWLTPYIVLAAWNGTVRYQYLIPKSMEKIYSKAIVIGIAFNLIMNFLLIKVIGVLGAILATVVAELIIALIQTKPVWKEMDIAKQLRNMSVFFVNGTIMYSIIQFVFVKININLLLKVIIEISFGAVIYLFLSIFTITLIDTDIRNEIIHFLKKEN